MGGKAWTEDELTVAADLSLRHREVAEIIGRSVSSIEHVRKRMREGDPCLMRERPDHRNPHNTAGRTLLAQTCVKCGWMLDAKFFGQARDSGRDAWSWRSACSWCRSKAVWERRKQVGAPSQAGRSWKRKSERSPTASESPRNGELWVDSEYKVIADPTMTLEQKARKIRRSYAAVVKRCYLMGYRSMHPECLPGKEEGQWQIKFKEEA